MAGAERDRFTLEELADQAGTYFNPHTEVVIVVDDSVSVNPELFEGDDADDAGESVWVRISEELPLDEQRRDEMFDDYETIFRPGEPIEDFDEVDELEPDPDPDSE